MLPNCISICPSLIRSFIQPFFNYKVITEKIKKIIWPFINLSLVYPISLSLPLWNNIIKLNVNFSIHSQRQIKKLFGDIKAGSNEDYRNWPVHLHTTSPTMQPWLTDIHMSVSQGYWHMDFTRTCTTHLSIVCKAAVGVIFSMTGMQLVLRKHCSGACFFSI